MVLPFGKCTVKGFVLAGESGGSGCGTICFVTFIALDVA